MRQRALDPGAPRRLARAALALPLVLTPLALAAGDEEAEKKTFDPAADAAAAVERAVHDAAKRHKRVLIVWGEESGPQHPELYQALRKGKTEAWPFYYEYELVPLDAGAGSALAAKLGAELTELPAVSVLDGAGKGLAHRAAAGWAAGDGWDEDAIGAFLTKHAVEPLDAEQVLAGQLARAKKENKRLIVHLGAPW